MKESLPIGIKRRRSLCLVTSFCFPLISSSDRGAAVSPESGNVSEDVLRGRSSSVREPLEQGSDRVPTPSKSIARRRNRNGEPSAPRTADICSKFRKGSDGCVTIIKISVRPSPVPGSGLLVPHFLLHSSIGISRIGYRGTNGLRILFHEDRLPSRSNEFPSIFDGIIARFTSSCDYCPAIQIPDPLLNPVPATVSPAESFPVGVRGPSRGSPPENGHFPSFCQLYPGAHVTGLKILLDIYQKTDSLRNGRTHRNVFTNFSFSVAGSWQGVRRFASQLRHVPPGRRSYEAVINFFDKKKYS